jgi:Mn-dependent DtxR family transcriptional regulator
MPKTPPPSDSANRLKEYLEIISNAQQTQGSARRWDVYKRAMNEAHTDHWLYYLRDRGLIEGDNASGYKLTKRGKDWLDLLKTRADLVGVLTRECSGSRVKRWDT